MYQVSEDLETAVRQASDPVGIVVVEASRAYPGQLIFQPFGDERTFYQEYHLWISRHLVLKELFALGSFVSLLEGRGNTVIFGPSCREILDDYRRWSEPLPEVGGVTLYPYQSFALRQALERDYYFFNFCAGGGKAQPVTEPVLTPSGWTTIGNLRPGDEVIGSTGNPIRVIATHPQGVQPVYRVEFNDGTFTRCNAEHLWSVRKRKSWKYRGREVEAPWHVMTTETIKKNMPGKGKHRWQTPPLTGPVKYDSAAKPLPLDPYTLGVLLGDGHLDHGGSICTDQEILDGFGWIIRASGDIGEYTSTGKIPKDVCAALKELGLWGCLSHEKKIPTSYLHSSPNDRMALLQGLLDTDGHAYKNKTGVEFSTTSPDLRDGVADLIRGLRGRVTVSQGKRGVYTSPDGIRHACRESWRLHAVFPEGIVPFRLSRKVQAYRQPIQRTVPHKIISAIYNEDVSEEQVCITVDAEDSLYVSRDYVLTHNSFISALGASLADPEVVLVFTLSKLKIDMLRRFQRAGFDAVINDGDRKRRERVYGEGHRAWVMNYEKAWVDEDFLSPLVSGRDTLIIMDECQKVVSAEGQNKARQAIDRLIKESGSSRVWPMSASVVGGNPLRYRDVFSLNGRPRHNPLGSKASFIDTYTDRAKTFNVRTRSGGTFQVTDYDWNLDRLQDVRHRVGGATMAVRKTDPGVVDQFRGMQILPEAVTPSAAEQELTDIIISRAEEAKGRGETLMPYYRLLRFACNTPAALLHTEDPIGRDIALKHSALVCDVVNTKLEMVNDKLEEIRESGDKALLFTHWTHLSLHLIRHFIAVPHVVHYGTGQTARQSQEAVDRFKNDPDITCFLTSDAGSHGLNMQEARYCLQYEPLYSYDDSMQRSARIDRADSHLDGLTTYVYITDDSVEQRIWDIQQQRRIISEAVQGTREALSYEGGRSEADSLEFLIFGKERSE